MRRPAASHVATTLALAAAALVVGCGGGGQATFNGDYAREHREVRDFGNDIARTFAARERATDDLAIVPRLRALSVRANSLDKRIGALDPPTAAKPDVSRLRQALGALRGDIDRVVRAIRLYNPGGWLSATTEAAADLDAMRKSADAVPTKG
jgi:hypothetical protein